MRAQIPLLLLASIYISAAAATPAENPHQSTMTLEQAYDIALASDQNIKKAFNEVRKAELLPLSALTRITPRAQGSYDYARSGAETEPAGGSSRETRSGRGTGILSVEMPIVDFSVFPAHRRAKLSLQSSKLARSFTIRETLFGVAAAYYEVLKQERLLEVNRQALELASQQEDLSQKRADVGEVTQSDVLRARVSVETARRTLIATENNLELRRNTLRNILNFQPDAPLLLTEPEPYTENHPAFEDLLKEAWAKREDLQDRELSIKGAEEKRRELLTQYSPRVVASADKSLSRTSGSSSARTESWMAGVSVQIPLFTGGQREIDLTTARHNIDQAVLDRAILLKKVEADVKEAWLAVRFLNGSLRAVAVQIQAAEQSYRDIQTQYRAGTAKSVDVLSALKDLNTARSDQTALTLDYQVALRSLEQMAGTFQEARVQKSASRP